MDKILTLPPTLKPGDTIAVISPASVVKPEFVDSAAEFFRWAGFNSVIMPHAKGPAAGSFAAPDDDRLSDIINAIADPAVKALFCARGGYGCVRLLDRIDPALISSHPKWLIGFSDISALHALWQLSGIISLHAPMAKHLSYLPSDNYCTSALMRILTDGLPIEYIIPAHPFNRPGAASGRLVGGNLAVINALADTPFDPLAHSNEGIILFIEDISEKIYAVERILFRLKLSGHLRRLKGLIIGRFTEYSPDRNHPDMETMINRFLKTIPGLDFPVAMGFPAGHTDDNLPLPLGAAVKLYVDSDSTVMTIDNLPSL